MARYRTKPFEIEATQWLKPGDHAAVELRGASDSRRYYVKGKQDWSHVDPGDWIITEPDGGGHYPCKPDVFAAKYEPVN